MDVSDIDGAKPKATWIKSLYVPEEIPGTKPKKEIRFLNNNNYSYDVPNQKKKKIIRDTNPLNPVYQLSYNKK